MMDLMEILTLATTVVTVASAVCAATPTPKRRRVYGQIRLSIPRSFSFEYRKS